MALSTARYVQVLNVAFGKRQTADTLTYYVSKLDKWQEEKQWPDSRWSAAVSKMVADLQRFPELSIIMHYVSAPPEKDFKDKQLDWLTFDRDGFRYAVPVRTWIEPPKFPIGSIGTHMVIANPSRYEPCEVLEGRESFIQGYRELGGSEDSLAKLLFSIMPKQAPPTVELEEW